MIERGYLAEEASKVAAFKGCDVHVTINAHGEPTLYAPMPGLVSGLSGIENVRTVSMITNCTLLTRSTLTGWFGLV